MPGKNINLLSMGLVLFSSNALAQDAGGVKFSTILLTIAILLGIASCLYVFMLSSKMKNSDIGGALLMYGLGMISVVVSLLSVTWLKTVLGGAAGWVHDGFFILGFLIMVAGSRRVAAMFSR